jgi:hypothetical protein
MAAAIPTMAAGSVQAAIGTAVAGLGGYVGECATTRSPDDIGKLCSKFVTQKGNLQAYLVGRTFSEFSEWVFVEQTANGWAAIAVVPYDGSAPGIQVPWPGGVDMAVDDALVAHVDAEEEIREVPQERHKAQDEINPDIHQHAAQLAGRQAEPHR